jgi:titin
VLTSVASDGDDGTTISGMLNSEPFADYLLQFFANDTAEPSGHGEGQRFLGSFTVTTDSDGNVRDAVGNLGFVAPASSAVAGTQFVTATATRLVDGVPFETSEFSQAFNPGRSPSSARRPVPGPIR